jgi:RecB family endonuclease NucS
MAKPSEATQVERFVERLRRDHPDPAMRAKLYAGDKLDAYVRALMTDEGDDAVIQRVVAAVRNAEDGTAGPMSSAAEPE